MISTTSPKSSFAKLGLCPKPKTFKVMVLGQTGVGKSALVVRFITRRFIGEYESSLEKTYSFQTVIDNEMVFFEILDAAGDPHDGEYANLESHIRWAEAFILMYSVTDKCSFDECHRLKFLINYNKRRRRLASSMKDSVLEVPVVLVGNKADQSGDRMITTDEGQRRSKEIGCVCFHEISVRESIEQVWSVFRDARRFWRVSSKSPRTRAADAAADGVHPLVAAAFAAPFARPAGPLVRASSATTPEPIESHCQRWTEAGVEEEDDGYPNIWRSDSTSSSARDGEERAEVTEGANGADGEFRARASTDSHLPPRPTTRARHPPPTRSPPPPQAARRMSVAMRGNDANTY